MSESTMHKDMKRVVRSQLERDSYYLMEEPPSFHRGRLSWSRYRPDLLGYRRAGRKEELVIVECETHPNMQRFRTKRYDSLSLQSNLIASASVRRILAVPQGRLKRVDLRVRESWEVWVVGRRGTLEILRTARLSSVDGGPDQIPPHPGRRG